MAFYFSYWEKSEQWDLKWVSFLVIKTRYILSILLCYLPVRREFRGRRGSKRQVVLAQQNDPRVIIPPSTTLKLVAVFYKAIFHTALLDLGAFTLQLCLPWAESQCKCLIISTNITHSDCRSLTSHLSLPSESTGEKWDLQAQFICLIINLRCNIS